MRPFFYTFLGVLAVVALFVWWADPGHRWHRLDTLPDHELKPGEVWPWPAFNIDELSAKKHFIEVSRSPDIAVLGSSRVEYVDHDMFRPDLRLLNLGVNSADINIDQTLWNTMKKFDRYPRYILLYIDPWVLNANWIDRVQTRSPWGAAYFQRIADLEELISLTSFIASLDFLEHGNTSSRGYRADGTMYDPEHLDPPPDPFYVVRRGALQFVGNDMPNKLSDWRLDHEMDLKLKSLLLDMRRQQIPVLVILPPFHPLAYSGLEANPRSARALSEFRSAIQTDTDQAGVTLCDAQDPQVFGCTDREFLDGYHMHRLCSAKVLSGCLRAHKTWQPLLVSDPS